MTTHHRNQRDSQESGSEGEYDKQDSDKSSFNYDFSASDDEAARGLK